MQGADSSQMTFTFNLSTVSAMVSANPSRRSFIIATTLLAVACTAPAAETPRPASTPTAFGVLVMAHGGDPQWNRTVLEAVKPLAEKYTVEVAFGMADATTMREAVRKLEARGVGNIGVVRLFISGESWFERTEQIFGLRPGAPKADAGAAEHAHGPDAHAAHAGHGGHSMAFFAVPSRAGFALSTEGLADVEEMGTVLADRASALSQAAEKEDVLILAHGPENDAENERWLQKLEQRGDAVRKRAPFRRVHVETLREDWPDKRVEAEKRIRAYVERAKAEGGAAIVIPFRVQGFGPYKEVLQGLDYVADGKGLLPHAEVSAWLERQIVALQAGSFRRGEN